MYERVAMGRIWRLAVTAAVTASVTASVLLLPAWAHAQQAEPGVLAGLRLETTRIAGHTYLASMDGGRHAELTLGPRLQSSTEDVLRQFQIPYGAAVAISIPDGRVLALVGQSAADPRLGAAELALRAWAPAASVFKVVSATALVA